MSLYSLIGRPSFASKNLLSWFQLQSEESPKSEESMNNSLNDWTKLSSCSSKRLELNFPRDPPFLIRKLRCWLLSKAFGWIACFKSLKMCFERGNTCSDLIPSPFWILSKHWGLDSAYTRRRFDSQSTYKQLYLRFFWLLSRDLTQKVALCNRFKMQTVCKTYLF